MSNVVGYEKFLARRLHNDLIRLLKDVEVYSNDLDFMHQCMISVAQAGDDQLENLEEAVILLQDWADSMADIDAELMMIVVGITQALVEINIRIANE